MDRGTSIWPVLMVSAVGTFMVILDTTIVNVALPRIITIFGSSVDQAQLVLTGYMLALATVTPAAPYLSQTFGSKRLYLLSLALFTIGSALCGLAWSIPSLVGARVIQGLGGGLIGPLGMTMLFQATPPEQRGAVMSKYTIPVMLAPIMGPSLGGFLVEYVDWRWVFFINLPFGVLGVALGMLLLRESQLLSGRRFDTLGFLLAAACSSGALLGLSDVPEKGWDNPLVAAQLTLAAITLPLFIWRQLAAAQPLLNLRLFAIPAFSIVTLVNFVITAAVFGGIFLLPVFLQNVRGLGAMQTGMLLLPQALASFVALQLAGRLYDRIGARPLILVGLTLLAATTWLLARLDVTTPDREIGLLLLARGFATGLTMMPAFTSWVAAAPLSQTPSATALNNVLRQLFAAFGTAVYATILQGRLAFHTANLAMAVQPDLPAVARLLAEAQQLALAEGIGLAQAKAMVVAQLAGQVRLAASVRAFDDCFLIGAVGCLVGLIPALFLSRGPARQAVPAPGPGAAPAATPAPAAD